MRSAATRDDRRVVLVAGASSGIGKASALLLAGMGYKVYAAARSEPTGFAAASVPHATPTYLRLEVRVDASARECVSAVLREAGRLDILINCAGVVVGGPAEEVLPEETMDQIQTNLLGTVRMCRAVLPTMRQQGYGLIVNVGSLAGLMGLPFQSAYSASKHGIEGYSESLQMEIAGFGIRVVVVEPGDIATEITVHRNMTQGTQPGSPYWANFNSAMRSQERAERQGWKVERAARQLAKIISSRAPRFRYRLGPLVERISPVARRVIPDRLYLRILAGFCGLKNRLPDTQGGIP